MPPKSDNHHTSGLIARAPATHTSADHANILVILQIFPHQVLHGRVGRDRLCALRAARDDEQIVVSLPATPSAIFVRSTLRGYTTYGDGSLRREQLVRNDLDPARPGRVWRACHALRGSIGRGDVRRRALHTRAHERVVSDRTAVQCKIRRSRVCTAELCSQLHLLCSVSNENECGWHREEISISLCRIKGLSSWSPKSWSRSNRMMSWVCIDRIIISSFNPIWCSG